MKTYPHDSLWISLDIFWLPVSTVTCGDCYRPQYRCDLYCHKQGTWLHIVASIVKNRVPDCILLWPVLSQTGYQLLYLCDQCCLEMPLAVLVSLICNIINRLKSMLSFVFMNVICNTRFYFISYHSIGPTITGLNMPVHALMSSMSYGIYTNIYMYWVWYHPFFMECTLTSTCAGLDIIHFILNMCRLLHVHGLMSSIL